MELPRGCCGAEFIERLLQSEAIAFGLLGLSLAEEFEQAGPHAGQPSGDRRPGIGYRSAEASARTGAPRAVPSPDPIPAGESTRWAVKKTSVETVGTEFVSHDGFNLTNAAKCRNDFCLTEGGHPTWP